MNKFLSLLLPALTALLIIAAVGVLFAFAGGSDYYIWIALKIFTGILAGVLIYFVNRKLFGKNPHCPSIRLLAMYSLPLIADFVIGILWLVGAVKPFSSSESVVMTAFFCVSLAGCVCSWLMLLFEAARKGGVHNKAGAFIGSAVFALVMNIAAGCAVLILPVGFFLVIPAAVGCGYVVANSCCEAAENNGISKYALILASTIFSAAVVFAVAFGSGAVSETGWGTFKALSAQLACGASVTMPVSALLFARNYDKSKNASARAARYKQYGDIQFDSTPSVEEYERIKDRL